MAPSKKTARPTVALSMTASSINNLLSRQESKTTTAQSVRDYTFTQITTSKNPGGAPSGAQSMAGMPPRVGSANKKVVPSLPSPTAEMVNKDVPSLYLGKQRQLMKSIDLGKLEYAKL